METLEPFPKGYPFLILHLPQPCIFGASPVIFIGQDLAYSKGQTHVKGATHGVPVDTDNSYLEVSGLFGPLKTSNSLKVFLDHFQDLIKNSDTEVIDATEGGAVIKGTKLMTLREILLTCLSFNPSVDLTIKAIISKSQNQINIKSVIQYLEDTLLSLANLSKLSIDLQHSLKQIIIILKRPYYNVKKLTQLFTQYESHMHKLTKAHETLELIRDNMTEAFMIKSRKFNRSMQNLDFTDHKDESIVVLQSNLKYYAHIEKAAKIIVDQIKNIALYDLNEGNQSSETS